MANLTVPRGTSYAIAVRYRRLDDEGAVVGNLTGGTIRFTVKTAESDDATDDAGATILKNVTSFTDSENGVVPLVPADTATLDPADYFFDIKVKESGGSIYLVDRGRFRVEGTPTNRVT